MSASGATYGIGAFVGYAYNNGSHLYVADCTNNMTISAPNGYNAGAVAGTAGDEDPHREGRTLGDPVRPAGDPAGLALRFPECTGGGGDGGLPDRERLDGCRRSVFVLPLRSPAGERALGQCGG